MTRHGPPSCAEAFTGESLRTGMTLKEKAVMGMMDAFRSQRNETSNRPNHAITAGFESIAKYMKTALDKDQEAGNLEERSAKLELEIDGTAEKPGKKLTIEYAELEDESVVIGVNATRDDSDESGKTVMVLDADEELGMDVRDTGEVVPLHAVPIIDKVEFGAVIDYARKKIANSRPPVITPVRDEAQHQPLAAG